MLRRAGELAHCGVPKVEASTKKMVNVWIERGLFGRSGTRKLEEMLAGGGGAVKVRGGDASEPNQNVLAAPAPVSPPESEAKVVLAAPSLAQAPRLLGPDGESIQVLSDALEVTASAAVRAKSLLERGHIAAVDPGTKAEAMSLLQSGLTSLGVEMEKRKVALDAAHILVRRLERDLEANAATMSETQKAIGDLAAVQDRHDDNDDERGGDDCDDRLLGNEEEDDDEDDYDPTETLSKRPRLEE